ncbi:MAG: hypothetical protein IPH95_19950 [Candidatus Promineofilum sp.]|nr:hypothetical protein [Promineifilum sp.]
MYPEDRVLVAYVPRPSDFDLVRREGWYRIPQRSAPKGLHAEVIAFYFGAAFGEEKYAIHYYARNAGHELARRRDLLPDEAGHPRANDIYYKVQLGPLQRLAQPIVSLRWRRLTFVHTTWDRFQDATEINDLFIEGGPYVDRLYATLKERGISADRDYRVNETEPEYVVALSVPTRDGRVNVAYGDLPDSEAAVASLADALVQTIARQGGIAHPTADATG